MRYTPLGVYLGRGLLPTGSNPTFGDTDKVLNFIIVMKIRTATKNDVKEIAKLMLEEFSKPPFKEKTTINSVIKSLNFYFKIGKVFVAIVDKNIIGVVVSKVEQWWQGPVILIEDLAIKEDFKKRGVGKNLMDKVEAYAKNNKIKAISFSTHKKSSAVKFYKKRGYKIEKNTLFMRKEIK